MEQLVYRNGKPTFQEKSVEKTEKAAEEVIKMLKTQDLTISEVEKVVDMVRYKVKDSKATF